MGQDIIDTDIIARVSADIPHSPGDGGILGSQHVARETGDNSTRLDYGPVVVLRHSTEAGDAFFTLYGHLSRADLSGLRPGQHVAAGATIGSGSH